MEMLLSSARQALMITLFVLSMMLIIEYLNVLTRGLWSKDLKKSLWKQVLVGAVLGIIPGCLGAYTAVSLYVHNIFGIGALVATMIATSGDEAFLMFSVIPETAVVLHALIFVIAIVAGLVTQMIFKNRKNTLFDTKHFHLHNTPECVCFEPKLMAMQLRKMRPKRLFLILFILLMIAFVFSGFHHEHVSIDNMLNISHESHGAHPAWIRITFIVVLFFALFTVLTVNDHFLEKHLWGHILKKHFLKVFLWSFGTLLTFNYLDSYLDLASVIDKNIWIVLIIAVLVGIIPESGPHFIFVILFAGGTLPFSILLANSIVQDGHGSLPLIAESQKDFVFVKAINIVVGFLIGAAGLLAGL
jgi:hypothetical protein